MPSFLRRVYDNYAAPALYRTFGDDAVQVLYEIGDTTTEIKAILRHARVEMDVDENGDANKRHRMQIVISTDPCSPFGGVSEPQLTARFVIDNVRWAVEPVDGRAIEVLTDTFALINLLRTSAVTKSYPSSRVD
jgi:hypothetical protein